MSDNKPRPVGRKRQVVASVTALAIVGGGVAYAAYSASLQMKGNIGRGQFVALYAADGSYDGPIAKITEGGVIANEPVQGEGEVSGFTVGGFYAKAYSTLNLGTTRTLFQDEKLTVALSPAVNSGGSTRRGYISGFTGTVPAGWKAVMSKGCGTPVDNTHRLYSTAVTFSHDGTGTEGLDLSKFGIAVTALDNGETAPVPSSVTCAPLTGTVAP